MQTDGNGFRRHARYFSHAGQSLRTDIGTATVREREFARLKFQNPSRQWGCALLILIADEITEKNLSAKGKNKL